MQPIIETVGMFHLMKKTSVFQGPRLHLVLSPVVALVPEHSPEVGLGR